MGSLREPFSWLDDEDIAETVDSARWPHAWQTLGVAIVERAGQLLDEQRRHPWQPGGPYLPVAGCGPDGQLRIPWSHRVEQLAGEVTDQLGRHVRLFAVSAAAALLWRVEADRPSARDGFSQGGQDEVGGFDVRGGDSVQAATLRRAVRRVARGGWSPRVWDRGLCGGDRHDTLHAAARSVEQELFDIAAAYAAEFGVRRDWLADPAADPAAVIGVHRILGEHLDSVARAGAASDDGAVICEWLRLCGHADDAALAALAVAHQLSERIAENGRAGDPFLEQQSGRGDEIISMSPFVDRSLSGEDVELLVDLARSCGPDPAAATLGTLAELDLVIREDGGKVVADAAALWSTACVLVEWAAAVSGRDAPDVAADACRAASLYRPAPRPYVPPTTHI